MKRTFMYLSAIIFLILGACSNSISIHTDYDKEVDFSQYKTFGFLKWNEESAKLVNDLDQRRLEQAVTNELTKRGMKRVDSIGDSMIGFHVVVETKTGTTAYTNYYSGMGYYGRGFGYGYGYPYGGSTSTTYSTYEYTIGTVVIDQFDAKTKKLMWEGVAQGEVDQNRKNRAELIQKDMELLFANYPIPLPDTN